MEWDKWVMTLGGRYDYAMASTLTRSSDDLAENHDQQFTWRGGINYLFDNGISPYFSYSESFEPVSGSSREGKPFDPSRGEQYEAGVKYVPKDMPVVVTAAVYQLTKDKNLTADPNDPYGSAFKQVKFARAVLSWKRKRRSMPISTDGGL
jgi:iron complex outermembrane receptor protein